MDEPIEAIWIDPSLRLANLFRLEGRDPIPWKFRVLVHKVMETQCDIEFIDEVPAKYLKRGIYPRCFLKKKLAT